MLRKSQILKKAQSAMESLMTYGWAIVVVMIAIGALAYFGVLSPSKFLPNECILSTEIVCVDFNIETDEVVLVLKNNIGITVTITDITVSEDNSCSYTTPFVLQRDTQALFTVAGCANGNAGSKFKGDLSVTYAQGSLSHKISGDITAEVTSISSATSNQICQNAQDGGLCDGLNLVYGEGYKAACCSEHTLCC